MKKAILVSVLAFLAIGLSFVSCKKKVKYSCNDKANNYATEFLESNQLISRDSLAKLDYEFQFAVFESLTNSNKLRIFKEKVDYLLNSGNLSEAEKAAFLELKILDESLYENNENTNQIVATWLENSKSAFGWDEKTVFLYTGTWLTDSEMLAMAESYSPASVSGAPNSCTCSYDFACMWASGGCSNSGCLQTTSGCGFWGGSKCTGSCGKAGLSDGNGSSGGIGTGVSNGPL